MERDQESGGGPHLRIGLVDAIEALSVGRGDTVDEILRWPPSRFESMYNAMVKRQAVEAIERQKISMIAALFTNPNWDEKENDRPGRLKEIEAQYSEAMELVYDPKAKKKGEQEIDWTNPFWKAAARAHDKNLVMLEDYRRQRTVRDVIEMSDEQLEARRKSRAEIDQLQ